MTCTWGCPQAVDNPRTIYYSAGCPECGARSLAAGPAFSESQREGAFTPAYRAALRKVFGADWTEGHVRVKAWAEKMRETA